ncbi:hypothetical protein acdb102_29020 [Acidothermaceae bacterium B102]|nr:hypothetical protein acdb102_29020 [Acidothermaceae bacterium B102]
MTVALKQVAPVRVAEITAVAESYAGWAIGPAISPLYPDLIGRLEAAGVAITGPPLAYYTPGASGDEVIVHACFGVDVDPQPAYDFAVVDLPAIEAAATVHHGPMSDVMPTMDVLTGWVAANGYHPVAWAREVYLDYTPENAANGVTELQLPVAAS